MNENIKTLLKEYGLKDKEIKLYLVLFSEKELTAYRIAKLIGIHRSTTYDILERLINKGFVSKKDKNKKIYYSANEISEIISRVKDKESILLSLIPEFEKIERSIEPNIRILEGIEGQKQFNFNLFNLSSNSKIDDLYTIGNTPSSTISGDIFIKNLIKQFRSKRLHKKIEYKGIWDLKFKDNEIVREYNKLGKNRFLENIPSKSGTVIFGDYVGFLFTGDKPYVIEIKNKLVAEEFRSYFNHLWKISK